MNMSKMNGRGVTYPSDHDTTSTNHDLVFPTAKGTNLARRDFVLPRGFEGALNLVFIAFKEAQQALVDSWMPGAKTLAASHSGSMREYKSCVQIIGARPGMAGMTITSFE